MLKRNTNRWNRALLRSVAAGLSWLSVGAVQCEFAFSSVRSFGFESQMGGAPTGNLIQASDGVFYGTTHGDNGGLHGTVYRLASDGAAYRVLHRFTGLNGDGARPWEGVIEGVDGVLYGTTVEGGHAGEGTVFRIDRQGTGFRVLHNFGVGTGDGTSPRGGLVQHGDGFLYGTTELGGGYDGGTVFRLRPDGSDYAIVRSFGASGADGTAPTSSLAVGANGAFYGITRTGGNSDQGTVFRMSADASDYRVIHSFGDLAGDGVEPRGGLLHASDGLLYGSTRYGGATAEGSLYRLTPDGVGYQIIHNFDRQVGDAANPFARLIEIQGGILCGTAASGANQNSGAVFGLYRDGTGYRLLHAFAPGVEDGSLPYAALVQGNDGALYGTTWLGGGAGLGIVFRLDQLGVVYNPIWHFSGAGGDGAEMFGGLLEGANGVLYGTTLRGGADNRGAVFRVGRSGDGYALLHSFADGSGDGGALPYAGLVEGPGGALYGTTSGAGGENLGTVFKLEPDGTGFLVLHRFAESGGTHPFARLLHGSDGALYGTATQGGSAGLGTVFRLKSDGSGHTVLHGFAGGAGDGANPYAGLIENEAAGVLYGTTWNGGGAEKGTVFRLAKDGSSHAVLRSFTGTDGDGANPYADLFLGSDGWLYGVTVRGGTDDLGTVFKLNAEGAGYAVLRRFAGTDGSHPYAGLVEGSDGALYGTTWGGGETDQGVVFRLGKDGARFEVVFSFSDDSGGNANPWAPLVVGRDGLLYGGTTGDGLGFGRVFGIRPVFALSSTAPGEVVIDGPAGYRVTLERRSNLGIGEAWRSVADVTLTTMPLRVTDPLADGAARGFYRTVSRP